MKKKIVIPVFMLACTFFLAGCSKVNLTGTSTGTGNGGAPMDQGGTPPDGGIPPTDGGTPPADAPTGGQMAN